MVESFSASAARRIALAAQGFGRPRDTAVGVRQLGVALRRLGVLQLDSVNVFERSHYLPLFARLGAYTKADLDRLAFGRTYTEYWGHQASVIPVEHRPFFEWRMAHFRSEKSESGRWVRANPQMAEFLRAELRARGPLAAREIEHEANRRTGPWWGWSEVKMGLESLFMGGEVAVAGRRNFERRYALAEDVVPAEHLGRDIPEQDAVRELVRISAQALGIGTIRDLADYFRLAQAPTKVAVAELVSEGELIPATVEGWGQPAWRHRDARVPRRIEAAALLSPFDPIVWERDRALRMFGFHYRIEIYTPEPQRVHGYYTLPVLMDEALLGRIDLKTDRQAGVLRVQSAWEEPGHRVDLDRVVALLRETATWQGMERIEVAQRGDLAPRLATAVSTSLLRSSVERT
jgi:uncharacterized protein YcaQ